MTRKEETLWLRCKTHEFHTFCFKAFRRKNALQDSHDIASKLHPRARSPQTLQYLSSFDTGKLPLFWCFIFAALAIGWLSDISVAPEAISTYIYINTYTQACMHIHINIKTKVRNKDNGMPTISSNPKRSIYVQKYTVSQKTIHLTFDNNFGKCLCNCYRVLQLTLIVLLYYLAKLKTLK